MYLRGEGVKQDPLLAKMWFERGAEYGEKESHNGLGIIWRDGLVDGKRDIKKALGHFNAAATQELAEAQVNIGKYHYGEYCLPILLRSHTDWSTERGDLKLATVYFESALRQGSPFEAYYYLADIQSRQARSKMLPNEIAGSSCAVAVSFYKLVAERGTWDDDMLRDADYAWSLGTERGSEMALLRWWIAAERGFEVAQNNLAYVLDQGKVGDHTIVAARSHSPTDKSILRFTRFAPYSPSNDTARLALTQWIRSAAQRNVDALVKVGDYYYYGLGVPDEPESVRWEKAAGYYQSAADTQMSALAMWNLGWMYENGIGVPQVGACPRDCVLLNILTLYTKDFHLAKRHYDLAYETNTEAYLPVLMSLMKLHARSIWHTLMGGQNGLTIWDGEEESSTFHHVASSCSRLSDHDYTGRSYYDSPEIEAGQETADGQGTLEEVEEFDDGTWYMGKARDEFNRRRRGQHGEERGARQEEDPVQWARDRRRAEAENEGDFGPEDYFDAATRGHRYREEEEVDEFAETMLLVVLCLMVSVLLYVRGRWVDRIRREEEERRRQANGNAPNVGGQPGQQQQNGANPNGVFPPPGDPARDDWAVLR